MNMAVKAAIVVLAAIGAIAVIGLIGMAGMHFSMMGSFGC